MDFAKLFPYSIFVGEHPVSGDVKTMVLLIADVANKP